MNAACNRESESVMALALVFKSSACSQLCTENTEVTIMTLHSYCFAHYNLRDLRCMIILFENIQ